MKDSKRPSDVSWPSGAANLRKEDFRLKVGVKSKMINSKALRPKNHLAWYVAYNEKPLEKKLAHMPQIKWKCPPKLVLDPGWHVVCGEESSEVDTQKFRETTVIEAVYPHLSAIPPSPLISPNMEGKHYDDNQIPLIPLLPIEEAGEIEMPFDTLAPGKTFNCHSTSESLNHSRFSSSVSPNAPTGENSLLNVLHGLEGGDLAVAAGAAAAVAAAMESKHEIDTELLIKFLADPEMMKTLINEAGIGSNSGPKSTMYPPSSNSTPDPSIDNFVPVAMNQPIPIKESTSDLGVTPAKHAHICSPNFVPVAMNQPIPIKESASDLGVTPAKHAHVCSPNLLEKWSPAPPRYSHPTLIQDLTNEAREPAIAHPRTHSTTGTNESRPLTSLTTLSYNENHYARLTDPQMVKTLANETGIGATSEPRFPSGMKSSTYPLSSNSTLDQSMDIFVPVAMSQPIPIIESASDLCVTPAKHAHVCSPNLLEKWSPAPPRYSHPPLIQDLTNEAREPAIAHPRTHSTIGTNESRPLTSPTTLNYIENHYARLTDPQMVKTLVNETGIGATSEPRFPSGMKSRTYPLSSNSTPDPSIDIFVPVAMSQPTPIIETASDLGVTPAKRVHICSPNLVKNWSPAPPRSNSHPLIQNLTNEAREPATPIAHPRTHGTTGINEPRPLTSPTTRSYNENHHARLTDPQMVKETGIGANSEPSFPARLKSTTYALSSISTPGPGIDIFVPVAMNQPIPIIESASDLGVTLAKCTSLCSPNLLKSWSPAPLRSNSHPPLIQDLMNEAREPAIARSRAHGTAGTNEPRPLTAPTLSYNENQYTRRINQYTAPIAAPIPLLWPPFSKPNWEATSKPIVKHHQPPYFTGIKPVSSPPLFSSTPRPYTRCMTDGFRSPDHAGLKPRPGSIPCTPFASELNCTSSSTFHPYPFPSMNKLPSPVENINYCKSQIKQHGETHIKNEDKLPKYGQPFNHLHELELAQHTSPLQINATFQKPCMFFNSSKGCRKGSNCQYMHVMSRC